MKPYVIVSVGLFLILLNSPLRAQDVDEQAQTAFDNGKKAFADERFIEAANEFREAYQLKPTWKLLFNIAQAEAAGKRYGLALETFEQYLAEGGDEIKAKRQELVQKEIKRLQGMVGYLSVTAPEGAIVVVNEVERGSTPLPGKLCIAAGVVHGLVITLGDEKILNRTIRLGTGETASIEAGVNEEEAPSEKQEEEQKPLTEPKSEEEKSLVRPLGWATLGVGALVAIAGGVTGGMTMSLASELDKDCEDSVCSESERNTHNKATNLATATNVLLPVGAALAVTGLVMVIVGAKKEAPDPELVLIPGPFGFSIEGRF